MTLKNVRGRIATGFLLATLLPAGAAVAQTPIEPGFDLCRTPRSRVSEVPPAAATGVWAPAAPLIPINSAPPWLRKTFYLFGTDGTCPVTPAIVAPVTESPASASLAASEGQPPGTVKNLRRTDRR